MDTINEIYNMLGASVIDNSPESWIEGILRLEVQPKHSSYNGIYKTNKGDIDISVFDFPLETGDAIISLHKLTTEGGHNKWNKAKFTVTPDKKFDMEFVWDQEWQDEVDGYNRQEAEKDPNYIPPKWHWEQ